MSDDDRRRLKKKALLLRQERDKQRGASRAREIEQQRATVRGQLLSEATSLLATTETLHTMSPCATDALTAAVAQRLRGLEVPLLSGSLAWPDDGKSLVLSVGNILKTRGTGAVYVIVGDTLDSGPVSLVFEVPAVAMSSGLSGYVERRTLQSCDKCLDSGFEFHLQPVGYNKVLEFSLWGDYRRALLG